MTLRRDYREARSRFSSRSGASVRAIIGQHVERLIHDLSEKDTQVALYKPLGEEADFALSAAETFFYPVTSGDKMNFYRPQGAWRKGAFGVIEPDPRSSVPLDLKKPVLIFCPAVAVDGFGARLGMGKGYYDKFFNDFPHAIRIAVVFQIQLSKHPLPVDSWDQSLDWIVTESMILRTSTRSP